MPPTTLNSEEPVKEGHAHLRPPHPATLGNDRRSACSRRTDASPIGPKHAKISLQRQTHEHIALTSIERQVILFGNLSFPNRVCLVSQPNAAVIKFRRDT